MTPSKIIFAGFNGFGQFKNLSEVVKSFHEIHFESLATQPNIIRCQWNYCAYVNVSVLYISGCINGENNQRRHIQFEHTIKDVACAENFCLVLLDSGTAYRVNCHTFEVKEINSTIIKRPSDDDVRLSKSGHIFGPITAQHENELNSQKDEFITHIATGRALSIVLTNKNHVYNLPLKVFTFPTHVKIKKISCGNEHCLILTTNGDLYAFGSSSRGQLGLGSLESEGMPVLIEALAGIKIIGMAAGGWHSVAVSAFNDLYVWGWNVNGQLGQRLCKTFEKKLEDGKISIERQKCSTVFASPIIVDLLKDDEHVNAMDDNEKNLFENQYHAISVSAGTRHTVVKVEEGSLMATGWNKYGQLSNDRTDEDLDQFHIIHTNVTNDMNVVCGEWSTFVIT